MNITTLQHPLAQHYLTHLRDHTTKPANFRLLTKRLTVMLAMEATQHLALRSRAIETPLEALDSPVLDDPLVAVPILRAGLVAAPEGVTLLNTDHPDVAIFTAGLDRELDSRKYILPGLGDFGDRLYGTE